jgi:hypothetical protein
MVTFVVRLLLRAHSAVLTGRAAGFDTSPKNLCNAAVFCLERSKMAENEKKKDEQCQG